MNAIHNETVSLGEFEDANGNLLQTNSDAKSLPDDRSGVFVDLDFGKHHAMGRLVWRMEGSENSPECEERCHRLVTCVNAMQGVSDPMGFVEECLDDKQTLKRLKSERDALVMHLKALEPYVLAQSTPESTWATKCIENALKAYK